MKCIQKPCHYNCFQFTKEVQHSPNSWPFWVKNAMSLNIKWDISGEAYVHVYYNNILIPSNSWIVDFCAEVKVFDDYIFRMQYDLIAEYKGVEK